MYTCSSLLSPHSLAMKLLNLQLYLFSTKEIEFFVKELRDNFAKAGSMKKHTYTYIHTSICTYIHTYNYTHTYYIN